MRKMLIVAALAAAAACSPPAKAPEPTGPQGLFEQAAAKSAEDASVMAWQIISTKQDLASPCVAVRNVQDKGVVPADVATDSIYAPYVGARIFSVQCGEQLTTVRARPQDRWLVIMRPGAMEAEIANCADPASASGDRCYGDIPTAAPAPADGAAAPADAAKSP
jgi:hypothetical protein